jgi:hypothetical protein
MQAMLNLLSPIEMKRLLKIQPMQIKEELIGNRINGNLIIVNEYLNNRPSDAQVGDNILAPLGTNYEGDCIKPLNAIEGGQLFSCVYPGKGILVNKDMNMASLVRVSRQAYSGRNRYRFLEEADDD